ncbi:DUF2268 domain-containing protein [Bacillus sp. BRMEA1]|uniref:DUF2268 domain-containing protein n=1 Tax=Neobacillus endophyticus TaxID=2738405 RepID=UPI00156774B9|nr:DUF2268 domain-containing protein [Neobacillus endophyticus]NRD78422.1 DUF2268 domain-containing protein [Neobacillus endophyticus]
MGIIRTDKWLRDDFDRPIKICEKLKTYFKGQTATEIYTQLLKFGMYRSSKAALNNLHDMKDYNAWDIVDKIFYKYQKQWSGPDIPIFLFPLGQERGFFFRQEERRKAGVSFPDKMFLFLSNYYDPKEIEALFVHEYHHVCRLRTLNKNLQKYTLLDSIIIEGLAEYAVLKNCGEKYLANWCNMYSERELEIFWDRFLKQQLDKKKHDRVHDELLYGGGRVPHLLGYAVGYNIVRKYYERNHYSTKLSFSTSASEYIK